MNYTISKTNKNVLILSSIFLMLYIVTSRLFYLFMEGTSIEIGQQIIQNILFLIPHGILMLAFFSYFKHYNFKLFQVAILSILVSDLLFKSTLFSNLSESTWKMALLAGTNLIWITSSITLVILLSRNKMKKYPAVRSIRNYSISILLVYIIATSLPFLVSAEDYLTTLHLVELAGIIPYIFMITFALKLCTKQ